MPDISPPVPVSVGPSALHTESSGVRDGSASVISTSWLGGGRRCFALSAFYYTIFLFFILFLTASTVCECEWRKKKAERINKFLKEEEARVKIIIMNFIFFFMIMKRKQSRKEVGKRKRRIREQKTGGILKMKWKIQHRLMVIAHFYRMSEFDNFEQTNFNLNIWKL